MFVISPESKIAKIEEKQLELVELPSHASGVPRRISLFRKFIGLDPMENLYSPIKFITLHATVKVHEKN